jgi:threonine/homoserine/homoserine lactone efflux protein
MDPSLAAYVTLTAILVVTPGASTALVVRHVLLGGRSTGMAAAAGIALANTLWAAAAGLGVTTILTRVPVIFTAIRFAGAGYLALLGIRALVRAAGTSGDSLLSAAPGHSIGANQNARAFRDGVAVNLLNPPVATFYIVVVPSFLPAPSRARFALFAAIHVGMALLCHTIWVLGFERLRSAWSRPAARRSVEAVIGVALLALAIRMLR